jgi:hypothetical protein
MGQGDGRDTNDDTASKVEGATSPETPTGPPPGHTLDDHEYGDVFFHEHGPDADHDHDADFDGPIEENPLWIADNVRLTSVGIDVGSSGTQVIFSRLHLRRMAEDMSSRSAGFLIRLMRRLACVLTISTRAP